MAQHQRLQLPRSDEHSHFNGHLTIAFKEKNNASSSAERRFFKRRHAACFLPCKPFLPPCSQRPPPLFQHPFPASSFPPAYTKIEKQNQNNSIVIFPSSYGILRG